ncbi:hypothetical protein DM02DRAFT_593648 [Periconia macrospinosa]|uniref:Rhodopsin domain-containing protein n=1 Tax=Periconia macrospinosa TaxID=97972 RepID=A0A2V1DP39_9PLEO|nr:hypothetical protein DM02DRAFT_593648 [Periconia macrospinosa]
MSDQKASWPAPNYENPENLHSVILGLTIPCMILLVLFLAIRCYARGVLRQNMKWDDCLMVLAACCSIPVSVFSLESLNYGLGLHMWDQKEEWGVKYNKMGFAADILFPIACSLTKISICLTYLRLFPSQTDRVFAYTMSIYQTLYALTCLFLMLFQCTPIRGYWEKNVDFHCVDMRTTLVTIAALNSLSDVLIYLWPAKPLWSLQLPLKQRLGLISLFSVGTSVCIAGAIRMYYLEVYFSSDDYLWNAAKVWIVMTLEMNLGIICGCLSGVRPVLAVIFPRYFTECAKPNSRPSYAFSLSTAGRRRRRPDSFPFESLSDGYDMTQVDDKKYEAVQSEDKHTVTLRTDPGKSFAWVNTTEKGGYSEHNIPPGAIQVKTVVTRQEQDAHSGTPVGHRSMAGSEDWMMEDTIERLKR